MGQEFRAKLGLGRGQQGGGFYFKKHMKGFNAFFKKNNFLTSRTDAKGQGSPSDGALSRARPPAGPVLHSVMPGK